MDASPLLASELCYSVLVQVHALLLVNNVTSTPLLASVEDIALRYFSPNRAILISLPADKLPLADAITTQLHGLQNWPIAISTPPIGMVPRRRDLSVWTTKKWDTVNSDKHGAYIIVTTADTFKMQVQIGEIENLSAWNGRARFLVTLVGTNKTDSKTLAKRALKVLWERQIVDVVVLVEVNDVVEIYSWFPYRAPSGKCAKLLHAELLDYWDNGFIYGTHLYPNKVPNHLGGCPIHGTTFEFPPFVIGNATKSDADGFEIRMMKCLAKYMGATLYLRVPPGDERGGVRLDNGTWTGLRADLLSGVADVAFASLLAKLKDRLVFAVSRTYFTDRFTWFVARAPPYPRWLGTVRVFTPLTWLAVLVTVLLAGIVLRLLGSAAQNSNYWTHLRNCLATSWIITLASSAALVPESHPLRIFFLSWVIHCFAVNTIFQAFFTSYVMNPGQLHQIADIEELLQSGYTFAFYYVLDKYFEAEFVAKLKPRKYCEPFACLDMVATRRDHATFCGRALLAYIEDNLAKQEGKHQIYAFHEDAFQLYSVLLFKPNHHLLPRADDVLIRIVEAGLPTQWLKFILDARRIRAGVIALHSLQDEYAVLSVDHLQGTFFFLFIGLAIAVVAFITEIIIANIKKVNSKHKISGKINKAL